MVPGDQVPFSTGINFLWRDLLSAESTPINMGNYYAQPIVAESDEDKANHIALFTSNPEIFRVW